jgi:predicted TIM-barrel fold metal-dependent hydrolase
MKGQNMESKLQVIDADAHVNPPPDFWSDYLPAQFRDRAPRLEVGEGELDYVVFEGQKKPFSRLNNIAGVPDERRKALGKANEQRKGSWDPHARLEDMAIDGVDAEVIFGGGPLGSADPALYLASFHAYNQWLAEFCAVSRRRLFGVAYIPMFDVNEAVKELKWAAAAGLKGVAIHPWAPPAVSTGGAYNASTAVLYADPEVEGGRSYGNEEFQPFWAACAELGMPVHLHLGATGAQKANTATSPNFAHVTVMPGTYRFRQMVKSKLAMAEVLANFVMTGILDRNPELRVVSVESGVGWMAFAAEYLDTQWRKHRVSSGSRLPQEPSFYFDRQVYGTFIEDRVGVNNRNLKGGRNIMWSSDYPHGDTSWPHSRESMETSLAGVPQAERDLIVGGNARKLYAL